LSWAAVLIQEPSESAKLGPDHLQERDKKWFSPVDWSINLRGLRTRFRLESDDWEWLPDKDDWIEVSLDPAFDGWIKITLNTSSLPYSDVIRE
jgi:hypothetical protein